MDDCGFESRQEQKMFLSTKTSRPGVRPILPPVQFMLVQSGHSVKLPTDLHLTPRLRTTGAMPPLTIHIFIAYVETISDFYKSM